MSERYLTDEELDELLRLATRPYEAMPTSLAAIVNSVTPMVAELRRLRVVTRQLVLKISECLDEHCGPYEACPCGAIDALETLTAALSPPQEPR